jgi:regulator of sigma E protease
MSVLVSIFGLAFLILIHEAGHFFTALAVGMRPRKFYVGFPPALVKTKRGGVEYGLGAIPLGGYVKIPGMHRPAGPDLAVGLDRARSEAPELTGPMARVERDLEAGDLDGARRELAELEAALAAAELSAAARKAAERTVQEIGDGLSPDAYWRAGAWRRIAVIAAGPGTNLLLAILIFAVLFMTGTTEATRTIAAVDGSRPAARAGIQPGDEIVAINGRPVGPEDIARTIVQSKGGPLRVTVVRGGRQVTLQPVRAVRADGRYVIGIRLRAREGPGESPVEALGSSLRVTWEVTAEIGKSLLRLSRGQGREEISSPVGIVQGSSEALRQGVESYLSVLGLISLSLALLNLLPLLPLDGGHIAFSVVEGIRGRAVPRHVYEKVSVVGIAIVLLLFFTGLSNDLSR